MTIDQKLGCADPGRREFVHGLTAGGVLALAGQWPQRSFGQTNSPREIRSREPNLEIGQTIVNFTGRARTATTINGGVPGPTLRWRQGDDVTIRVANRLSQPTSIHWHGLILPWQMDGVPGLSFDGIAPGSSFTYRFPLRQAGTYWYHSHTGFQEQLGHYGALIIDPLEPEPHAYDREYIVMLSDWTDEDPMRVFARLKKASHYYNYQRRTISDVRAEIRERGLTQYRQDRRMWARMRMSDRDLSDVTGFAYTYLMNGQTPASNWTALFNRGERVRLRFINSSAMTLFDVRIPGLEMTVIAADGQNIDPVTIDEFRIGVAETYDVLVSPMHDVAYSIFAQAIDRSGYAAGTLTPDISLAAEIPELDRLQPLTMADMGMAPMDMGGMSHAEMGHAQMDHAQMGHMQPHDMSSADELPSNPGIDMRAMNPQTRFGDPGPGLRDRPWRVLTYEQLGRPQARPDPDRELTLRLTGSMSRYMWSFDGTRFSDADPIELGLGENVCITLINDTMMNHPIHLHGLWSDLETNAAGDIVRKHTIVVQPGQQAHYRVAADAVGPWAYHCHLLYHMEAGMFRVVRVS
ncbi:MAG: copper resistance system multicopper oxidase [Gammaproteobacteria bacterium]|nr:copper resistance system multicopper oxidase [Gammaproteobacteria bacterium]